MNDSPRLNFSSVTSIHYCLAVIVLTALSIVSCGGSGARTLDTRESKTTTRASSTASLVPKVIILEREVRGIIKGKRLSSPTAIRCDESGAYFVIDRGNQRLLKFDSSFAALGEFGGANGDDELRNPIRLALDGRGNLFLADNDFSDIFQLDVQLNLIKAIPFVDAEDALKFGSPGGLGIDRDGELWVSDYDKSRIAVFNSFGLFKEFYADFNSGGSHLERPGAMYPRPEGGMIVCDEREGKVIVFNSYGVQIEVFGKKILQTPVDVHLDSSGRIWVCDKELAEILCFSETGDLLFRTADLGAAYNIKLTAPQGICIRNNMLIISDSGDDRIIICRIVFAV